jgi:hypothetical protein
VAAVTRILIAVPKNWFCWDFDIQDENQRSLAEVRLSNWLDRGAISIPGNEYKVSRERLLGAFTLEQESTILARAEKPNLFLRQFIIESNARTYTLKAWSAMTRAMVLTEDEVVIGKLVPESFMTRRTKIELPEELPLFLRMFVVWLTMVLWKRDSESA